MEIQDRFLFILVLCASELQQLPIIILEVVFKLLLEVSPFSVPQLNSGPAQMFITLQTIAVVVLEDLQLLNPSLDNLVDVVQPTALAHSLEFAQSPPAKQVNHPFQEVSFQVIFSMIAIATLSFLSEEQHLNVSKQVISLVYKQVPVLLAAEINSIVPLTLTPSPALEHHSVPHQ